MKKSNFKKINYDVILVMS